jgi:hypothetical protein
VCIPAVRQRELDDVADVGCGSGHKPRVACRYAPRLTLLGLMPLILFADVPKHGNARSTAAHGLQALRGSARASAASIARSIGPSPRSPRLAAQFLDAGSGRPRARFLSERSFAPACC